MVRWVVLGLLQDGACTDLVENLSVNSLKGDLSNATTCNPPLFSLVNTFCAAKAIFYCPSMNSHRPRSQNISKESTLNPEKDSSIKRPRSHVSLEKSSQNYKPLEKWAKPNLPPDITPHPSYCLGECIWRVCHVVKPEPREFLAILTSQRNWPRTGERAGWIVVWPSSLTGW